MKTSQQTRRGAVLVWSAALLVFILALAAFGIDLSYVALVATQLQNAADGAAIGGVIELPNGNSAVIAEVQDIASQNQAAGQTVQIAASDVEFGWFDMASHTFNSSGQNVNAIRVTARVASVGFFFAPILGRSTFTLSRSAVGMLSPRDIAFAVDLSGSMNDDTEPCWATNEITDKFSPLGFDTVSFDLMQDVYDDFGFGTFPGANETIFQPLGMDVDPHYAYAEATKDDGPLTQVGIDPLYRIFNTDDEPTRKLKAYSWVIDNQIARLMPAALPTPDSADATSYTYWKKYLDYILDQWEVGIAPPPPPPDPNAVDTSGSSPSTPSDPPPPSPPSGFLDSPLIPHYFDFAGLQRSDLPRTVATVASASHFLGMSSVLGPVVFGDGPPGVGVPRLGSTAATYVPSSQDSDRLGGFNNPNYSTFPDASWSNLNQWFNRIGYITYTQFMMDWGRDRTPVARNSSNAAPGAGTMSPLSLASPDCPLHLEATAAGTFSFPPREQPTHAVRRALIAAINEVKLKNAGLTPGTGDRVSVITFDGMDADHAPRIVCPLTDNYNAAMQICTQLQAVSDIGNTTATENGVITARQHIASTADGGQGRGFTTKVLVLCTDGVPNVWQTSQASIDSQIAANTSSDYYDSPYVWYNAVLMQAADMQRKKKEKLYPVGMGLGADLDFLDRVARLAGTDQGGLSPRGTGNPADYEQQLIQIFQKIINTRSGRLVK